MFRPDLAVTAVRINNVRHFPCITRRLVTVAVSTNSCRVYLESQSALFGGWSYCDPTAKNREPSRSVTAIAQIHTCSALIIAIDHTRLRLLSAANRITHARWGRTSLFFPFRFFAILGAREDKKKDDPAMPAPKKVLILPASSGVPLGCVQFIVRGKQENELISCESRLSFLVSGRHT